MLAFIMIKSLQSMSSLVEYIIIKILKLKMLKFGKYILKQVNNRLEIQEFAKIYIATRELTQKGHCMQFMFRNVIAP